MTLEANFGLRLKLGSFALQPCFFNLKRKKKGGRKEENSAGSACHTLLPQTRLLVLQSAKQISSKPP